MNNETTHRRDDGTRKVVSPKNPMGKSRTKDNPYLVFEGGTFGGKTLVLKSWQANNAKPYGRWFIACNGDLGDAYVYDVVHYYGQLVDYDHDALDEVQVRAIMDAAFAAPKPVW